MNTRQIRNATRWLHIVAGAMFGAFLYSPMGDVAWFGDLLRWGAMPVLAVSGIWMWQGHRLMSKFRAA